MFDLYLTEPFVPFTIALSLLFGLLALEIILSFLGATLLGLGADADIDLDLDAPDVGDLDIDIDGFDAGDFDFADPDLDAGPGSDAGGAAAAGPAAWLGIGKMPVLIWVAAVLLAFGLAGLILQNIAISVTGAALPALVIALPAGVFGMWFARQFGAFFARVLPKTESTALSNRHLGRRTGTVTQGVAKRGNPAEVRIIDRYGNMHYLRGEPLKDDEDIATGTRVLVLRHRHDHGYRLVPLEPET
ncbi:OB-fold-containig protein [uncultured Roseobacter sp.]|uniref:OB-fold-containig protein n=1 Tax=uncultured Roseobacter sp. TaxID=114847 RepID=UPI00263849AE|nr:OB-fold-containig protein [uncultured Roseobacter sp.]